MFNLNKKFDARAAACCLIASETIVSSEKLKGGKGAESVVLRVSGMEK